MLQFVVPGIPAPQGSKNAFGGEDNPRTKPWRETVAAAARDIVDEPFAGPILVAVTFIFPRPKAHYRTGRHADELRENAPNWHTGKPDLDKLLRAIGDALSGVLVRDDAQIAGWIGIKTYGPKPGAEITITTDVGDVLPTTAQNDGRHLVLVTH